MGGQTPFPSFLEKGPKPTAPAVLAGKTSAQSSPPQSPGLLLWALLQTKNLLFSLVGGGGAARPVLVKIPTPPTTTPTTPPPASDPGTGAGATETFALGAKKKKI